MLVLRIVDLFDHKLKSADFSPCNYYDTYLGGFKKLMLLLIQQPVIQLICV
jgi:hypothetical protein